ncbi:MAG: SdrD B-like domain-containing protein, partial [Blastocatellia bacterium]
MKLTNQIAQLKTSIGLKFLPRQFRKTGLRILLILMAMIGVAGIGLNSGGLRVAAEWTPHPPPVDLSLTKQILGMRPLGGYKPGNQIVFQLVVSNAAKCLKGDGVLSDCASATNLSVRDVLPEELKFVSVNPSGVYDPATGIWSVPNLHATQAQTLQITATIRNDAHGDITNYAQVWRANPEDVDSTPGNNSTNEDDDASVTIQVMTTKSSLAGNVYVDGNNNGARDQGEDGIGGVTITLKGKDSQGNAVSLSAITQSNGSYVFADLMPGTYTVAETQPNNYLDGKDSVGSAGGTLGNDQISNINLGSGVAAVNYNFGEQLITRSSIAGNVYVDNNNNGVRDDGEVGIGGVKIALTGTDRQGNNVSLITITNSNGSYIFANLVAGTYKLVESQPADFLDGKDSAGSAGGSVSNDLISNINLGSGVAAVNYNFGELAVAVDLAITKSHSGDFTAGSNGVYTITVRNAGNIAVRDEILVTDFLPAGMTFVSGTGNGWTCGAEEERKVVCGRGAPLDPGASTTITLTVSLATRMLSQVVNMATVFTPGDNNPSNDKANDTTRINNAPPPPPTAGPCDSDTGSVLLFPIYTSDSANGVNENTRITITNTNQNHPVSLHLFFVDGATCGVSNGILCLTQNQTASFLMSDMDPGTTGYLVVVAVDEQGCPVSFNHLIGQADVRFASGQMGALAAETFPALYSGTLPGCNANSSSAVINFDGTSYGQPGNQLAVPMIPSLGDGNNPLIVMVRTGGNLMTGASPVGALFGVLYNDQENGFSFSVSSSACQLRAALTADFPRTAPRIPQIIPTGRTGWMRIGPVAGYGVAGVFFNNNTNQGSIGSAFNGGIRMPKLRCGVDSYTI